MVPIHRVLLFWAFLSVIILGTSCLRRNSDSREDASTLLRFMYFGNEMDVSIAETLVREFEAQHPGVAVNLEVVGWTRYQEKLMTQAIGGRAPDLVRLSAQWMARYAQLGLLADVTEQIDDVELTLYQPDRLASCHYAGKLHGLPQTTIALALFVNCDRLSQAGIPIPKTPEDAWTLDEFEIHCRALKERGDTFGWAGFKGFFPFLPFIYTHGGHLLNVALDTPAVLTPEFRNGFHWFVAQHQRDLAAKGAWSKGGDTGSRLFMLQSTSLLVEGVWRVSDFDRLIDNFEWDVTYLPYGLRRANNVGGENLAVFNGPRQALAFELARYLTGREASRRFAEELVSLPARRDLDAAVLNYRVRGETMPVFAESLSWVDPAWVAEQSIPEFSDIEQELLMQTELAIFGFTSEDEALQTLDREMRAILKTG